MKFVPPDLRVGQQVLNWHDDPTKIQQGTTSGKWLMVEILAVKGPMVVISTGASIFQVNASELRRPLDSVDLDELPDSGERTGAPVLWLSCEGQTDVWELFSDDSFFECHPWSTRTYGCSPNRSENKESWMLLTTGIARLLVKDQKKESQDSCDVPDGFLPHTPTRKKPYDNSTVCVWPQQNINSSVVETFPYFRTRIRKDLVVEECTLSEEVPLPMCPHAWQENPSGFSINIAIFYNRLSSYQLRVSEWFQRNGKYGQFLEMVCPRQNGFQFVRHNNGNIRWSETSWILPIWAYERKQYWSRNGFRTGLEGSEPSINHYDRPGCAQFSEEYDCRCPVRP